MILGDEKNEECSFWSNLVTFILIVRVLVLTLIVAVALTSACSGSDKPATEGNTATGTDAGALKSISPQPAPDWIDG